MNTLHIGREIIEDDGRYYLTIKWEGDLTSSHDKSYRKMGFDTRLKAVRAMNKYLREGAHWFDAHIDPSLVLTSF